MSDRFTERMRNVVSIARGEALRFRHGEVGSEHLLLGIIADDGSAAACLAGLGIQEERVRDAIGGIPVRPRGDLLPTNIQFGQDAVAALDGAIQIASAVGKTMAGPEHLLAAVAQGQDSGAVRAIRDLGVAIEDVRVAAFAAIGVQMEQRQLSSPPASAAAGQTPEAMAERLARVEAKVDEILAILRAARS